MGGGGGGWYEERIAILFTREAEGVKTLFVRSGRERKKLFGSRYEVEFSLEPRAKIRK